ncbi:hypothetical protein FRC09_013609 [Ceratobasidium sp. 395]|nr:hypothetical protein FRC09_013609 [Ceratobasidium sp. 395]
MLNMHAPTTAIGSTISTDADVQAAAHKSNQDFSTPAPGAAGAVTSPSKSNDVSEADRPQPTVTKVSDPGVKGRLLNVRDVVAAPFAGSRAPKSNEEPQSPGKDVKSPEPGPGASNVDQSAKTSANAEGIRTTENPHTAHTGLAPAREEGTHVGGTGVAGLGGAGSKSVGADPKMAGAGVGDPKTAGTGVNTDPKMTGTAGVDGKTIAADGEILDDAAIAAALAGGGVIEGNGAARAGNGVTGDKTVVDANGHLIHIPGVSMHGQGRGRIIAGEDGGIRSADAPHVEKEKETKSSGGGSLSRLLSRSRTSVDATHGRRASVDEASKSPKKAKSRFSEEPSASSEAGSTPTSPSSSRFKVPLKDKIRGELKIISGKVSRNEAKVEQGIALKTGHASDSALSPK